MKGVLEEVEAALLAHKPPRMKWMPESYIGGGRSKLRFIGLKVPQVRQTLKAGFSFSRGVPADTAKAWDYVWREADSFEALLLALTWFYEPRQKPILRAHWPMLKRWSARIDNWAHADGLSGIYARILEEDPKLVYPVLVKWNASPNSWLRRLSIVSLLYYRSQREKCLPCGKILPLVEALLDDEDYYVRKGVGWTLRECGNEYPNETYRFMEKHILRLHPHAFSAATEKLTAARKARLKALRAGRARG